MDARMMAAAAARPMTVTTPLSFKGAVRTATGNSARNVSRIQDDMHLSKERAIADARAYRVLQALLPSHPCGIT